MGIYAIKGCLDEHHAPPSPLEAELEAALLRRRVSQERQCDRRRQARRLQPEDGVFARASEPDHCSPSRLRNVMAGWLKHGNPPGDLSTARPCGARGKRSGAPCRAPAMRNGRCRLHGGLSTGPRTADGARSRRARWKHGGYSVEARRRYLRRQGSAGRSTTQLPRIMRGCLLACGRS